GRDADHSGGGAQNGQRGAGHRLWDRLRSGGGHARRADLRAAGFDEEHRPGEDRAGSGQDHPPGAVDPVLPPGDSSRPRAVQGTRSRMRAMRSESVVLRRRQAGLVVSPYAFCSIGNRQPTTLVNSSVSMGLMTYASQSSRNAWLMVSASSAEVVIMT